VGGAYVRDAAAPDRERVCGLLRDLPLPERDEAAPGPRKFDAGRGAEP
jgi:hypothetical protein